MPPTADLQIAYDGPALSAGEMDVRDLAPALLAVGDLFQEANELLNGDQAAIGVNVKAVERGSFQLHLVLDQIETALGLFPDNLKTARELAAIVFGSQGALIGVIALIKLLRGKPIHSQQIHQILRDGSTIVDLTNANLNNSPITIAPAVKRLYESEPARKAVERIVKPLKEVGIDSFQVREGDVVIQEVTADEVDFFTAPSSLVQSFDDSETERIATFQIVTASFEDRYQWRLTDGSMTLVARIEDDTFFQRIDSGERFGKGDLIRVRLLERQWRDEKGLHAEYKILEVLEIIPGAKQMSLA